MRRCNLKKIIALFVVIPLFAISLISCASAITEETTIWTEFIETYLPTIWTTPATTEPTIPTETTVPTEPVETEPILFGNNITFSSEYVSNGEVMPYALYTPSTTKECDSIPLIVWLHGAGERGVSASTFFNRGLPKILNEWTLEGFNMYVLCPHLTGKWNPGRWDHSESLENLKKLLDKIIVENNIDPNRVIISGCSLGGFGSTYMAWKLPEYFSKLVVVSGYQCQAKLDEIHIPAICFAGTVECGEDRACVNFMKHDFASVFGKENTFSRETSHAKLPSVIFNEDKDGNNRSDLIEWMFEN